MSSIFQGINVSGMQYSGRKSFDSFTGLTAWIDPKVNAKFNIANSGTRYKNLQDRSINAFNWTEQNGSAGVFKSVVDGYTALTGTSVQGGMEIAGSPNISKWKALNDGSPFTIYWLFKVTAGATGSTNTFFPLVGSHFAIKGNPANVGTGRRAIMEVKDDSGTVIALIQTSAGAYEYNTWTLGEINNRGRAVAGNDVDIYINDVLKGSGDWGVGPVGSNYGQPILLVNNCGSSVCYIALVLIYDHTGKTESQTNVDRMEIRQLIQEIYGI